MRTPSKASRRYAAALLAEARAGGALEAVRDDMASLVRSFEAAPSLSRFLSDYTLGEAARGRALAALFAGRLHALTWRFLRLLDGRRRAGSLADIGQSFLDQCDRLAGFRTGELRSATTLADASADRIAGRLRAREGGEVRLKAVTDASLIGGFQVRIDDRVYDLSVAGQLRRLHARMAGD